MKKQDNETVDSYFVKSCAQSRSGGSEKKQRCLSWVLKSECEILSQIKDQSEGSVQTWLGRRHPVDKITKVGGHAWLFLCDVMPHPHPQIHY